jgi:hypothetical protein
MYDVASRQPVRMVEPYRLHDCSVAARGRASGQPPGLCWRVNEEDDESRKRVQSPFLIHSLLAEKFRIQNSICPFGRRRVRQFQMYR